MFHDDSDDEYDYLVEPVHLRTFDGPPFCVVGEVLEFIRQMLEVRSLFLNLCFNFTLREIIGVAVYA